MRPVPRVTIASCLPGWVPVALILSVASACSKPLPVSVDAVPEARSRLTYQLPADSSSLRGVLQKALTHTVCLVRSGRADECQEESQPPSCDTRSAEEVRVLYASVFDSIPRVMLSTPFSMSQSLGGLFPGATPTITLHDARRTNPCSDWNQPDGACAAVRTREVWFLFRGPAEPRGRPTTLEVFLAALPCRRDL
ncbi:MAG: hypothetical protein ABI647_16000 [Gemmatimonadota bacterium]